MRLTGPRKNPPERIYRFDPVERDPFTFLSPFTGIVLLGMGSFMSFLPFGYVGSVALATSPSDSLTIIL